MVKPNGGTYLEYAAIHTIEHLAATYLRNDPVWKEKILYFGPMGCRTGFYLLLAGEYSSEAVLPLVKACFALVADFEGEVPGASAKDCGNYLDMNLPMAKYWGKRYYETLANIDESRLTYPE
jgi:S-ribosylhomocysteine lyase